MEIHVKFFASAAELVGQRELKFHLPDNSDVSSLIGFLCEKYPSLAKLRSTIRVAINLEYASSTDKLNDGDEVAVIPPISGGIG